MDGVMVMVIVVSIVAQVMAYTLAHSTVSCAARKEITALVGRTSTDKHGEAIPRPYR